MKCYRKVLRIPWTAKITNEEVRNRLNIKTSHLMEQLKKQKLGYFGHIKRHDTLEKTILEGKLEGRRGRGRPRRSWDKNVEEWLGESVADAGRLAQNRHKYRKCTRAATSSVDRPDW